MAEEGYWTDIVDGLAPAFLHPYDNGVLINAAELCRLPEATARRLLRRAIQTVKGDLRGINFSHVNAFLDLCRMSGGHGRLQAPGIDAVRSFDWLRIAAAGSVEVLQSAFDTGLAVPGITPVPGSPTAIRVELVENSENSAPGDYVYNEGMGCVDWRRVSGSLQLRSWRPGDRYQPLGHTGEHKIKYLFQDARIPLWERRQWPVITDGPAIVWVRRFGTGMQFAADARSRVVLKIQEQ